MFGTACVGPIGYVVLAGRADGRLLTMKLVAGLRVPPYRPSAAADRRHFLLDAENCSDDTLMTFDPIYQHRPTGRDDDDDDGSTEVSKGAYAAT